MKALKIISLLAASWGACLLASLVLSFGLLVATHKKGGRATGEAMVAVDITMAVLYVLTLPVIFFVLGRWIESLGARLAIVAGQTILLAGTWFLFAFILVVVLNR